MYFLFGFIIGLLVGFVFSKYIFSFIWKCYINKSHIVRLNGGVKEYLAYMLYTSPNQKEWKLMSSWSQDKSKAAVLNFNSAVDISYKLLNENIYNQIVEANELPTWLIKLQSFMEPD